MDDAIIADASLFNYSFDILTAKLNDGIQKQNNLDMALIVPAAVNGALGCELYMKAMIQNPPHEHKLDKLFDLLDSDVKSFISKIMVDLGKDKDATYDNAKFKAELGNYSGSFVEWRYFYEYEPKININFIKNFLVVLKGTVEAQRKGVDLSNVRIETTE